MHVHSLAQTKKYNYFYLFLYYLLQQFPLLLSTHT